MKEVYKQALLDMLNDGFDPVDIAAEAEELNKNANIAKTRAELENAFSNYYLALTGLQLTREQLEDMKNNFLKVEKSADFAPKKTVTPVKAKRDLDQDLQAWLKEMGF